MTPTDAERDRHALVRLVSDLPSDLVPSVLRLVELFTDSVESMREHPAVLLGQGVGPWDALSDHADGELWRDLQAAATEADAGNVIDHDQVVAEMRARFAIQEA